MPGTHTFTMVYSPTSGTTQFDSELLGDSAPVIAHKTRADLSEPEPDGLAMTESVAVRNAIRLAPPPGGWGTSGASRSLCKSLRASSVPHLRAGLRTCFEFRARATVWCHHGDLNVNPRCRSSSAFCATFQHLWNTLHMWRDPASCVLTGKVVQVVGLSGWSGCRGARRTGSDGMRGLRVA